MRYFLVATCAVLMSAVFLGCSSISSDATSLLGKQAPESRLMLLTGDDIAIRSKEGTNVALLFWATWCSHSSTVISDFEDLARLYAWKGDLEFFAVSVDKNENIEVLKSRIQSQDLKTVTHVFSGNDTQDEAFLAFKGDHVPYVVFVDARGVVRFVDFSVSALSEFLQSRFG